MPCRQRKGWRKSILALGHVGWQPPLEEAGVGGLPVDKRCPALNHQGLLNSLPALLLLFDFALWNVPYSYLLSHQHVTFNYIMQIHRPLWFGQIPRARDVCSSTVKHLPTYMQDSGSIPRTMFQKTVIKQTVSTFPKSRTSNRSNASKSSLFLIPNVSQQADRNVRIFFRQRNWGRENNSMQWIFLSVTHMLL